MNKEVVISTFERDYDWIDDIHSNVRITVYRKGEKKLKPNEIYIDKNVGRDVHTFFYHIVNRFNSLSDYTFTSQDYFMDHVTNYVEIINSGEDYWNEVAVQSFHDYWFFNNCCPLLITDIFGYPNHPDLDIKKYWDELFVKKCPNLLRFTPAGHFCITKEQIKKRPLSFYKKILNILETDESSPWIIERLEPYIFDLNYQIRK